MKNLMVALSVLFMAGCATNSGIFDPNFWQFGAKKQVVVIVKPIFKTDKPSTPAKCKAKGGVYTPDTSTKKVDGWCKYQVE